MRPNSIVIAALVLTLAAWSGAVAAYVPLVNAIVNRPVPGLPG